MTFVTSFDSVKLWVSDTRDPRSTSDDELATVLLLHGYASTAEINFRKLSELLVASRFRVIAPDLRGHGKSDKPHDASSYSDPVLTLDATAVIDAFDIETFHVVGYSMGAYIALRLALRDSRVTSLVMGGVGTRMLSDHKDAERIVAAMLADDPAALNDPWAKSFRDFADLTGSDRFALGALQASGQVIVTTDDLAQVSVPTLLVTGERDLIASDASDLVQHFRDARHVTTEGDHLSAPTMPSLVEQVTSFLVDQSRKT